MELLSAPNHYDDRYESYGGHRSYGSGRITRTKRTEPCSVCGDIKGKCGVSGDLLFCMEFPDGGGDGNYRYLKPTANGMWGIYISRGGQDFDAQGKWRERKQEQEQRRLEELDASLSILQRHFAIRDIKSQLSLSVAHRRALKERGFSDRAIDSIGYRSLKPKQPLSKKVSDKLAGVAANGCYLTNKSAGILIPIPNKDGHSIGYQIRNDEGSPKYVWPWSADSSSHLRNGELPIGFFSPQELTTDGVIGLAEGFTKSPIAAYRLGMPIVGAAGANFVSSPQQLKGYLSDYKEVILFPDAGSVKNFNIINSYSKIYQFCRELKLTFKVAWYGQFDKPATQVQKLTAGDIDEIDEDTLESIEYIGWGSFERLFSPDVISRLAGREWQENTAKEPWDFKAINQKRRQELTKFTPNLTFSSRYFPRRLPVPSTANLVAIKGEKGTGKTVWLSNYVKARKTLILTHRVCLEEDLANVFRLDSRHNLTQEGHYLGHALCINSLHPNANPSFDYKAWEGASLVMDEFDQLYYHLVASSTCDTHKSLIIETWVKLMNYIRATGGTIYVSSADLSDIHVKFLRDCIDMPLEVFSIENTAVPFAGGRRATCYEDKWDMLAEADRFVATGNRTLIFTTSIGTRSKTSTRNLEKYYSELGYKVLRADAESVSTPNHPAAIIFGQSGVEQVDDGWSRRLQMAVFLSKLGLDSRGSALSQKATLIPFNVLRASFFVKKRRWDDALKSYDIVLASPVLETGVSIVGVFNQIFYLSESGLQTVESVGQSMARERTNVPRHFYVPKTSRTRIRGGGTHWPTLVSDQNEEANRQLLQTSNYALIGANFTHQSFLRLYCQTVALHNIGFLDYRQAVTENLEKSGYVVSLYSKSEVKQAVEEQLSEIKQVQYDQHCEAVAAAFPLTEEETARIRKRRKRTEEERIRLKRQEIQEDFIEPNVTPELVKQSDGGLYKQALLHYYLTVGNQFVEMRDIKEAEKILRYSKGTVFEMDVIKASISSKIAVLKELDIERFLDPNAEFTQDSLEAWFNDVCKPKFAAKIRRVLGLNPTKQKAIAFVNQQLLPKLGLKLKNLGQKTVHGKRIRVYGGAIVEDSREVYFARWFERDEKALKEFQENRETWELDYQLVGQVLDWVKKYGDGLLEVAIRLLDEINPLTDGAHHTCVSHEIMRLSIDDKWKLVNQLGRIGYEMYCSEEEDY